MLKARAAYHDLISALEMLEVEEDAARFRVHWVAAITLARAIGHILHKVDSNNSPEMKAAISNRFKSWKESRDTNGIFFEFIDNERNSVLKEYEFGYLGEPLIAVQSCSSSEVYRMQTNLFCPICSGTYAGEDCRDVLREAACWWNLQLSALEGSAA